MPGDLLSDDRLDRLRRWAPARGRLLLLAYAALLALALSVAFLSPLRSASAGIVDRAMRGTRDGWIARVERGETMVAAGAHEEAIAYLTALDRRFPARTNRHALDMERERLLHALGRAYVATDRKGSALDTYRRAVLFDPRNVENHFALALAALRFDEPEEAALHLGEVLRIHPSHGGAVREAIGLRFEDGDYRGVVELFDSYLAAFRVHPIPIDVDGTTIFAPVVVDGGTHAVRVSLPEVGDAREVRAQLDHPGLALEAIERMARPSAGVSGVVRDTIRPAPPAEGAWQIPLGAEPSRTEALVMTLSARIPVDAETWERVRASYRNRLEFDALEAAADRLVIIEVPTDYVAIVETHTDGGGE